MLVRKGEVVRVLLGKILSCTRVKQMQDVSSSIPKLFIKYPKLPRTWLFTSVLLRYSLSYVDMASNRYS